MTTREKRPSVISGIEGRRKVALEEGSPNYKARRQEVIRVAADIFKQRGYEAATLGDVAAELGTDRASLYYYIGSKEELLHEIVRSVITQNLEAAERVKAGKGKAPQKIQELIEEMITSFHENYPHMYVYIEDLGRIAREESEWSTYVLQQSRRFEKIVVEILDKGRKEGSLRPDMPVELCALALFGMVNWTHRWYRPGSKFDPKKIAETFTTLFLDGYRSN